MKNIVLINMLYKNLILTDLYPISLAYIGSYILENIKSNVNIEIIDMNLYKDPFKELEDNLKQKNTVDIVGISVRNFPTTINFSRRISSLSNSFSNFSKVCRISKLYHPNALIVVGGPAFSLLAKELMDYGKNIDIGVISEGEKVFVEILNKPDCLESIKGIYYWKNGQIKYTGDKSFLDPADIPVPKEIKGLFPLKYSFVGLQTKRGCTFECVYCPNKYLQGNKFRLRSVDKIIDEIKFYKKQGVKRFFFADPVFNVPKDFALIVLEAINNANLKIEWGAEMKASYLDREFLQKAERSGCILIDISADSGSDEILNSLKTEVTVKDIINSAKLISNFRKISPAYFFTTNTVFETFNTALQTIKLSLRLRINNVRLRNIFFSKFMPIPHTELAERLMSNGETILLSANSKKLSKCHGKILLLDLLFYFLIGLRIIFKMKRSSG